MNTNQSFNKIIEILGFGIIPSGVISPTELVSVPDGVPGAAEVPENTTSESVIYGSDSNK